MTFLSFNAVLQFLGALCSIVGVELNARKKKASWVIWFVGNLFWFWWYVRLTLAGEPSWFALLLAVVYMGYNVRGYVKWRKDERIRKV